MSFFSILLTLTMLELPALAIALPFFFFVFQKLQFFFLSVFVVIIFHFHTALIRQSVHKSIHFHCFAINTVCRGCRVFVTLFIVVFSFFLNLFLEFRCYLYVTFIYCFFSFSFCIVKLYSLHTLIHCHFFLCHHYCY